MTYALTRILSLIRMIAEEAYLVQKMCNA